MRLSFKKGAPPRTGQTPARTDALLSRPETGKMTASVIPIAAGWHSAMRQDNVKRIERFGVRLVTRD
jgi:hypothetical protein